MKIHLKKLISGSQFIFLLSSLFFLQNKVLGQTPQDVPKASDSEPLAFNNPTTIIFFVVLPLLFIGLYFVLRKKRNNP